MGIIFIYIGLGVSIVVTTVILLFVIFKKPKNHQKIEPKEILSYASGTIDNQISQIFTDQYREELRNRGRIHFEKSINDIVMFLQQDLRLTTTQLNDFLKQEVQKVLSQEFGKYEKSIAGAKEVAVQSLIRTQKAIEQQREILIKQMQQQYEEEKTKKINKFENNMYDIVSHYIVDAVGNEVDLNNQLDYIFANLEKNKQAMIEDIHNGA